MAAGRKPRFRTLSGIDIKPFYAPEDLRLDGDTTQPLADHYRGRLGDPGSFPFARGVYKDGYRVRLPTIREFAGLGTALDTNERLRYLIGIGQTGLSIAYDEPTLYGRDSDNEDWSLGYVGKDGVAVDTLADYEDLFRGISLADYSVSQTINFSAIVKFAMFLALAKKQDVPARKLRGTIQTDILKEVVSQKEYRFPLRASMRLIGDMMEYAVRELDPGFYPINVSGYHMGEAGASPAQELSFTLQNAFAYFRYFTQTRGLGADESALRMSLFFNCKGFWEDIAKFRAARRIWAGELAARGVTNERALAVKFHVQNSGASFRRTEVRNNVKRGVIQCLAAFLGGAQSIHINSWDEEIALPSDEAVKEAIRTQQIIGEEMNITDAIDPLGGSYFVEYLTDELERRYRAYADEIAKLGGMIRAIECGFPQLEIQKTSYEEAERIKSGEITVVGFNKYCDPAGNEREERELYGAMLRINTREVHELQKRRLRAVRTGRDNAAVERALARLADAARGSDNLVPFVLEAVEAYATKEEIMIKTLEPVFGRWRGPND